MIGDSGQADEVERVNLVIRSDLKGGDGTEGSLAARLHVTPPSPPITPPWLHVTPHPPILLIHLTMKVCFIIFKDLNGCRKKEPIPLSPHFSSLRKHVTLTAVQYQQNTCSHLIIQNKSDFATLPHHPQLWFSVPRESRLSTQTPKNDPKEKKFIIFVYSRFSTRAPNHHDTTKKEKVLFHN